MSIDRLYRSIVIFNDIHASHRISNDWGRRGRGSRGLGEPNTHKTTSTMKSLPIATMQDSFYPLPLVENLPAWWMTLHEAAQVWPARRVALRAYSPSVNGTDTAGTGSTAAAATAVSRRDGAKSLDMVVNWEVIWNAQKFSAWPCSTKINFEEEARGLINKKHIN